MCFTKWINRWLFLHLKISCLYSVDRKKVLTIEGYLKKLNTADNREWSKISAFLNIFFHLKQISLTWQNYFHINMHCIEHYFCYQGHLQQQMSFIPLAAWVNRKFWIVFIHLAAVAFCFVKFPIIHLRGRASKWDTKRSSLLLIHCKIPPMSRAGPVQT